MEFYFFLGGLFLSIVGWFAEKAEHFVWIRNLIAPVQNITIETLDALTVDYVIRVDSVQGQTLLSLWPSPIKLEEIAFIGRSTAYQQFGANKVHSDIQLIAYSANEEKISTWVVSEAKEVLCHTLDRRMFILGTVIFWTGIGITFVSGLVEFFNKK